MSYNKQKLHQQGYFHQVLPDRTCEIRVQSLVAAAEARSRDDRTDPQDGAVPCSGSASRRDPPSARGTRRATHDHSRRLVHVTAPHLGAGGRRQSSASARSSESSAAAACAAAEKSSAEHLQAHAHLEAAEPTICPDSCSWRLRTSCSADINRGCLPLYDERESGTGQPRPGHALAVARKMAGVPSGHRSRRTSIHTT